MPRIQYRRINFMAPTLSIIRDAVSICVEYDRQGFTMTMRQLYYQFISRDLFPDSWIDPVYNAAHNLAPDTKNTLKNYKRLGGIVDDARYAGLLDWDYIVDRTRTLHERAHWGSPNDEPGVNAKSFVDSVMPQFRTPKWETQPLRMEVWIEKDALVDVVARPANGLDLPYFACRGYNSTSNAWEAARRIEGYINAGFERVVILHLGDHDPEGIDMSRDIEARFRTFLAGDGFDPDIVEVRRIALSMDQIRLYNPPPNPAKETSSRYAGYAAAFGTTTSWELDALDPPTIDALIRAEVEAERDDGAWLDAVDNEVKAKGLLQSVSERWGDIVEFLEESA